MPYRETEPPPKRRRTLIECPGCHVRVMPNRDGICPSCRVNVDEVDDDQMRRITVRDKAVLPEICVQCGKPTPRRFELEASRKTDEGHSQLTRIAVAMLFNPIVARFLPAREELVVTARLGLCPDCPEVRFEHVDFERGEITFLAHRELRGSIPDGDLVG